jgi:hypothetical protein
VNGDAGKGLMAVEGRITAGVSSPCDGLASVELGKTVSVDAPGIDGRMSDLLRAGGDAGEGLPVVKREGNSPS